MAFNLTTYVESRLSNILSEILRLINGLTIADAVSKTQLKFHVLVI